MTVDFRALCAELLLCMDQDAALVALDKTAEGEPLDGPWRETIRNRARAALAEPEPPIKGEVAELVAELKLMASDAAAASHTSDAKILTRAADLLERLAQPEPVGPTDEELCKVLHQAICEFSPMHPDAVDLNGVQYELELEIRKARAVLTRWGNQ